MKELALPKFESKTVEFKQFLNDGEKSLTRLKTVDAFANTNGGSLYVGVKDQTYEPIGLSKEIVDSQVQLFIREVKEHITPLPTYNFEYLEIPNKTDSFIIKINILREKNIFYLKYNGFFTVYLRDEGRNYPATPEKIEFLFANKASIPYDLQITDVKYDERDFTKLHNKYREIHKIELTFKTLLNIGFVNKDGFLARGALIFKDNYRGEATLAVCNLWKGINKGIDDYETSGDLNGNIFDNIERILSFVQENNKIVEVKLPTSRLSIPSYPTRSVFESVVNAYAHKNYYYSESFIQINLYFDRLEIVSPGSLLDQDIDLKRETNISSILPTRRNQLICEVLSLCNYMEKRGSGFEKITEDYKNYSGSKKPYIDSDSTRFIITLPNLNTETGVIDENTKNLLAKSKDNSIQTSKKDEQILGYCYYKERTLREIASLLNIEPSSYLRNEIIGNLIKNNLLYQNKNNKAITYLTNKSLAELKD